MIRFSIAGFWIAAGLFPAKGYSQTTDTLLQQQRMRDSLRAYYFLEFAAKAPLARQAYVSVDVIGSGSANFKLGDEKLFAGNLDTRVLEAYVSLPLYEKGSKSLKLQLGETLLLNDIDNITNYDSRLSEQSRSLRKSCLLIGASYGGATSVFGKPMLFNANLTFRSDNLLIMKRITATGLFLFPLKQTAVSRLSVGGVVILGTATSFPLIPFVSYWQKVNFLNSELFVDFPKRLSLRKAFTKRLSANLSSEIAATTSFFDFDGQGVAPDHAILNTAAIKNGLGMEYRISKYTIVSLSGGLYSTISSQMLDRNAWYEGSFVSNTNATAPYCNVTFYLLPVIRPLFKHN